MPVEHPGMARAFARWISRHPDDGRYVLTNGWDWTYLTVEGAPFFVETITPDERGLRLRLSDGSEELCDPRALTLDERGVLFTKVKGGAYDAQLSRTAQLGLEPYLEEGPDGAPILSILGVRYELR
jgi:hypothetical protein